MKKDYTIDWKTNTLTMSKKFAEEANQYGTDAYKLLMDVRSKGFAINVKQPKPRKSCPTRITYKKMKKHIACLNDAEGRLDELNAVIEAAKGQKNPYEYVRKWFFTNYPDYAKIPVVDNDCRIVAPRLNLTPEDIGLQKIA